MKLSDEKYDVFRRLPTSFNDMIRAAFEAGHTAGRSDAYIEIMDMAKEKLLIAGLEQCS